MAVLAKRSKVKGLYQVRAFLLVGTLKRVTLVQSMQKKDQPDINNKTNITITHLTIHSCMD
jgi:hypothetical protein